jgi:hypothetical protein
MQLELSNSQPLAVTTRRPQKVFRAGRSRCAEDPETCLCEPRDAARSKVHKQRVAQTSPTSGRGLKGSSPKRRCDRGEPHRRLHEQVVLAVAATVPPSQ